MIPISNRSWLLTWLCWSYQSSFHQPVLNFSSTCSISSTFQITFFSPFPPVLNLFFHFFEVYSCAWSKFKAQGKNGDEARKKALATRVQSLSPIRICHIPCMHHMCVLNYMLCLVYVVYVLNFATDKVDRGQWIHRRSSCDEVSLDWMSRF